MRTALLWVSLFTLLLSTGCSREDGGSQDETPAPAADSAAIQAPVDRAPANDVDRSEKMLDSEAQAQLAELATLVDRVAAAAAQLPQAEFDRTALSGALGNDPQVLFEWVRDHTWWAPYRGLLRGSQGVMLDRVGSNLDRAVLLGSLLRDAGHTVRLAHAELSADQARTLLGRMAPMPAERLEPGAVQSSSSEHQRAVTPSLPSSEQEAQQRIAESQRIAAEAQALVRDQSEQLYEWVRDAVSQTDNDGTVALNALRDHWWIEREENGGWIAMDVLLPDAAMGQTNGDATGVSEWPANAPDPSIPADSWHSVAIRVVVERYENGVTSESVVLETVLRPAEVLARPITLFHLPAPWPDGIAYPSADPNALGNAVVNVQEWTPFLRVGDDLVVESAFTEAGDLKSGSQGEIGDVGGAGITGGMEAALGGDTMASSSITAEWIDYEVRVPGAAAQTLRRPIFDLLGPARRQAGAADFDASTNERLIERYEALLSATDILLQPCNFTPAFVVQLSVRGILANQQALRDLARERDSARAKSLAEAILAGLETWGPLPDLALWRAALGGNSGNWFIDRPNILNYRISPRVVNADRLAVLAVIDFAENGIGIRLSPELKPFEVRLRQGVADTVAEMLTLGSDLTLSENTASLFARASQSGAGTVLIGPHGLAAGKDLPWPDDPAVRLAAHVDSGFMAVALGETIEIDGRPRVGWWRIDPASGATIGVMDNGFHASSTTDRAIIEYRNALREFLKHNGDYWRGVRAASRDPFTPVSQSQYEMLALRDYIADLLRRTAAAGF